MASNTICICYSSCSSCVFHILLEVDAERKASELGTSFLLFVWTRATFESEELIILWDVCMIVSQTQQTDLCPNTSERLSEHQNDSCWGFPQSGSERVREGMGLGKQWVWAAGNWWHAAAIDTSCGEEPPWSRSGESLAIWIVIPIKNLLRIRGTLKTTFASSVRTWVVEIFWFTWILSLRLVDLCSRVYQSQVVLVLLTLWRSLHLTVNITLCFDFETDITRELEGPWRLPLPLC